MAGSDLMSGRGAHLPRRSPRQSLIRVFQVKRQMPFPIIKKCQNLYREASEDEITGIEVAGAQVQQGDGPRPIIDQRVGPVIGNGKRLKLNTRLAQI